MLPTLLPPSPTCSRPITMTAEQEVADRVFAQVRPLIFSFCARLVAAAAAMQQLSKCCAAMHRHAMPCLVAHLKVACHCTLQDVLCGTYAPPHCLIIPRPSFAAAGLHPQEAGGGDQLRAGPCAPHVWQRHGSVPGTRLPARGSVGMHPCSPGCWGCCCGSWEQLLCLLKQRECVPAALVARMHRHANPA